MVVPGRLGGWRGGRDGGAVIGQKAQEVEPSQRLRSVSCHPIAEAVRTDRIPRRVSRGRVRSQEGVGRALRKAPWMGWPGEGGVQRPRTVQDAPPEAALAPPLALGLPLSQVSTLSSAIGELISHI